MNEKECERERVRENEREKERMRKSDENSVDIIDVIYRVRQK